MPLTKQDLKAIDDIVKSGVVEGVGQVIEDVVSPRFQGIEDRLDTIESDIGTVKEDVADIKHHIGTIEDSFAMPAELRFRSRKRPLRRAA